MGVERFERVPLLFGPSPVHRLERLSEHLGGERRRLGEARGLQLGTRVRRKQGAEARVPRRGRARDGLRHARVHRRRAVEPHAAGRGRRGSARSPLRPRAGALGGLAGRRLRQGRQHPPLADHGGGRPARPLRLRHRDPQELGGCARVRRGDRRHAVPDPGRCLRPPARRPRVRALGGRGRRAGARARRLLRHRRRLLRDRLDAGRDDRRASQPSRPSVQSSGSTGRPPSRRPGIRSRGSREPPPRRSSSDASSRTPRSSSSTNGTRARTASPTRRRSTPSGCAPGSRACSPTRCTRGSRWPP